MNLEQFVSDTLMQIISAAQKAQAAGDESESGARSNPAGPDSCPTTFDHRARCVDGTSRGARFLHPCMGEGLLPCVTQHGP